MKLIHSDKKDLFKIPMPPPVWTSLSGMIMGLHMAAGSPKPKLADIALGAAVKPPVNGCVEWSRRESHCVVNVLINYGNMVKEALSQRERIIPQGERDELEKTQHEIGGLLMMLYYPLREQGFEEMQDEEQL